MSADRLTVKQHMLKALGEMQIVLESEPRAQKQVEAAIHHWELSMAAEGCGIEKEPERVRHD